MICRKSYICAYQTRYSNSSYLKNITIFRNYKDVTELQNICLVHESLSPRDTVRRLFERFQRIHVCISLNEIALVDEKILSKFCFLTVTASPTLPKAKRTSLVQKSCTYVPLSDCRIEIKWTYLFRSRRHISRNVYDVRWLCWKRLVRAFSEIYIFEHPDSGLAPWSCFTWPCPII